jgi:Flp pilus assembly protein TadD
LAVARLTKPYELLVKRQPENNSARMQLAIHYARFGLTEQAERIFDQLQQQNPKDGAVFNNRGSMQLALGDFESAFDAFQRAERLSPGDAGIKFNLALAYYYLGNSTLAREKFEEATAMSDTKSAGYSELAKLLGL